MDVPSDITTVFVKLMVILKSLQALAKRSHRFCKYTSEWATRAASSAYSNSRISTRLVLVLARSRERLSNLPVLGVWRMIPSSSRKACARRPEKTMPNNVGARTQTCLTPLQIGKVLDMDHQTGLLPSCSHGTLKGRKAAFQAAQQFEYVIQAHRIEGFGQVYENHIQRAWLLGSFFLKLYWWKYHAWCASKGAKATLTLW